MKQQLNKKPKRRNCDKCVLKKVRCSGRIGGGPCAYCKRKTHKCVFSIKQKPGPKCRKHVEDEAEDDDDDDDDDDETDEWDEESLAMVADADDSVPAALSIFPPGVASASAAVVAAAVAAAAATAQLSPSVDGGGGSSSSSSSSSGRSTGSSRRHSRKSSSSSFSAWTSSSASTSSPSSSSRGPPSVRGGGSSSSRHSRASSSSSSSAWTSSSASTSSSSPSSRGPSSSSSSKKRKAIERSTGGLLYGEEKKVRQVWGYPATFFNLGRDGSACSPGVSRTSGGEGRVPAPGFIGRIGGDQLSVGTLGHGNGSFRSSLPAFASTVEEDRATMSKLLDELDHDSEEELLYEMEQQKPPGKKLKVGAFAGFHESLQKKLEDMKHLKRPRPAQTAVFAAATAAAPGGHSSPPSPPRLPVRGSLDTPPLSEAHKAGSAAAAEVEAADAALARAMAALPRSPTLAPAPARARAPAPAPVRTSVPAPTPTPTQQRQQQQQQRLMSRLDSGANGSWRWLLGTLDSSVLNGGGFGGNRKCNGGGGRTSGPTATSGSATNAAFVGVSRARREGPAATAAAAAAAAAASPANPLGEVVRGRVGPAAALLSPSMHVRSHSYGLGDWLPPADIAWETDFLAGLPGVPTGEDLFSPLVGGGIMAGREHQF